jgi:hypothetical protein
MLLRLSIDFRRKLLHCGIALVLGQCPAEAGDGYDSGAAPRQLAEWLAPESAASAPRIGTWLRLRDMHAVPVRGQPDDPRSAAEHEKEIERARAALLRLRETGYRPLALIRWSGPWTSGVRSKGAWGAQAPLDLREAHTRARRLAATYGDLIEAWEVENEPDIGFFADQADVFAAYYKAIALGLAAGRAEAWSNYPATATRPAARSLIVMPAMALPPGPYVEQLLANDFLAYAEGANLHYYGFAEDYRDAHARLREALGARPAAPPRPPLGPPARRPGSQALTAPDRDPSWRKLPVFVTEWGYARLDGYDAQTVAGRVRQWRYFQALQTSNRALGVSAPMAFYLPPFFEYGAKEFGLGMPPASAREAHYGFALPTTPSTDPELRTAGGLAFAPGDFGVEQSARWMGLIGSPVGPYEASPALAWLIDEAQHAPPTEPRGPGAWWVRETDATPVVLDLLPGENMISVKNTGAYWLGPQMPGPPGEPSSVLALGRGTLVFYNFAAHPVDLKLHWPEGLRPIGEKKAPARLAPGERYEVPVELTTPRELFSARAVSLEVEVETVAGRGVSRWSTWVYPFPAGYEPREGRRWDFAADTAAQNRAWLAARPHAAEEPRLQEQGRWRVTPGVRVEETVGGWRLHVDALPAEPLWPAVAELPLPDDWAPWSKGTVWSFDYRIAPASFALRRALRPDDPDPTRRRQIGRIGDLIECYLRTQNGNMHSTQPRLYPTPVWERYNQPVESLTPHFPGRIAAPGRADRERPAALVFFLRPAGLPTVFEIDRPTLAPWRPAP